MEWLKPNQQMEETQHCAASMPILAAHNHPNEGGTIRPLEFNKATGTVQGLLVLPHFLKRAPTKYYSKC